MDLVAARRLRSHEGRKLRRLKRQLSNAVNSRRARIILLSRGGLGNREIAERVGLTPQWVRTIIHRFNTGGVDGITWYPYFCGDDRPTCFAADVVERICEIAISTPRQLIGMSVWSLTKLRAYLIEQRIVRSISIEWLRQILRRCRIRWRHTKTWKQSHDAEFRLKYTRIRRLYGNTRPDGVRLCIDEFGPLNLLPRHGKHYARIGHVDRLRATYHRTGGVRHFMGVYDLEHDTLNGYFVEKKNRRTFLSFLRWLRRRYRDRGALHIVLDNATFHSRTEVLAYAAANDIRFYWTPTSASWTNRIESHFTAMRKFTLDNTDYPSHEEMQRAILDYLAWRNRRRKLSCEAWTTYRRRRRAA
jgi:transposase